MAVGGFARSLKRTSACPNYYLPFPICRPLLVVGDFGFADLPIMDVIESISRRVYCPIR